MSAPAWAYRGFPNSNSQPSYDQWRQSILIEFAGESNPLPESPGEARGVMPDTARHPFTARAVDGGTGRGAGPETGPASDHQAPCGGNLSPFHSQGDS
jgi:hypothetical protein